MHDIVVVYCSIQRVAPHAYKIYYLEINTEFGQTKDNIGEEYY
jgi:hypothetical protein